MATTKVAFQEAMDQERLLTLDFHDVWSSHCGGQAICMLPAHLQVTGGEAGWTPDQWGHSKSRSSFSLDYNTYRQQLTGLMRLLLKSLIDHTDAWPFKEPVDSRDVPDYYDIIKDPIDLKTMSRRVESEQYYVTLEMFVADLKRMFVNARTYNSPDTIYFKCSTRLEGYFTNRIQAHLAQAASTKS